MGGLSPVLEAYLAGSKQQQDIIAHVNSLIEQRQQNEERKKANLLREKELNDITSRFDTTSKQQQDRINLERQAHDSLAALHLSEARDKVLEQFSKGQRSLQGNTIQDPTATNMSKPLFQPNPQQMIDIPGFGQQSFNTNELDTPAIQMQRKIDLEKSLANIDVNKASRIEEGKQSGREILLQNRLDAQANQGDLKRQMDEHLKMLTFANQSQLTDIKAEAKAREQLANIGFSSPEDFAKTVVEQAHAESTGQADHSAIAGGRLKNAVETYKRDNGLGDFPGGTKGRQAIMGIAQKTQDLVQKFDKLMADHPPPDNFGSRLGNKIAGATEWTQTGKDFAAFKTNIIDLMQSKGVNNTKLIDTGKEQDFMGSMLPSATSEVKDWENKRTTLVRNAFTAIQNQISGLSKQQRQSLWRDIIDSAPYLKMDPTIENELTEARKTGNWNAGR